MRDLKKVVGLATIPVGGVYVKLFKDILSVEVEIDGEFVEIFSEKLHGEDHLISHIIEPNGIADRAKNQVKAHPTGIQFQ